MERAARERSEGSENSANDVEESNDEGMGDVDLTEDVLVAEEESDEEE